MNKYFMLMAAAELGTTASAQAGNPAYSFTFAKANGKPYCDGGTVYTNGSSIWA